MKIRLKRQVGEYPKGSEFSVQGIHWNESGKFKYYVSKDDKVLSIEQEDSEIL